MDQVWGHVGSDLKLAMHSMCQCLWPNAVAATGAWFLVLYLMHKSLKRVCRLLVSTSYPPLF